MGLLIELSKLPVPPSVNSCYSMRRAGSRIMKFRSHKFNEYIRYMEYIYHDKHLVTVCTPIMLDVCLYFKGRISDIDNVLKVLFDGLQYSRIIGNDSQIKKLTIEVKKSPCQEAYLDLAIYEY